MEDKKYDLYLGKATMHGMSHDEVIANIAKLFNSDVDKVKPLFATPPKAVKRNIDQLTAKKYKAALNKAGASVDVVLTSKQQPSSVTTNTAPTEARYTLSLAPAGASLLQKNEKIAPRTADIDTSHIQLDNPFLEPETQKPATNEAKPPTTDHIQLSPAETGFEDLHQETVAAPIPDISNISLAAPGSDISTQAAEELSADINPPDFDIADVGEDLIDDAFKKPTQAPADIPIDHLKIEE